VSGSSTFDCTAPEAIRTNGPQLLSSVRRKFCKTSRIVQFEIEAVILRAIHGAGTLWAYRI